MISIISILDAQKCMNLWNLWDDNAFESGYYPSKNAEHLTMRFCNWVSSSTENLLSVLYSVATNSHFSALYLVMPILRPVLPKCINV